MSKKSRLLDLFSNKTDNEPRENPSEKNHEIRSLIKQVSIVDPSYIASIKELRPQPDDLYPLSMAAMIPYINDQNYMASAWDLLMLMTKSALASEITIFNPETKLPFSTYERGTRNLILDDTSEWRTEESYIGNWLVRFGDAVDWFRSKSLPFAERWSALPATQETSEGETEKEVQELPNWKMKIQAEATAVCLRMYSYNSNPTRSSISETLARWCQENNVLTGSKILPTAGYIRMHVIGKRQWTMPGRPREHAEQTEQTEQVDFAQGEQDATHDASA
jgi:hypothetical protein